jgi:putative OPT family oligopeptide transporter
MIRPNTTGARREITPRVIVLGLLLSIAMGAANVYVGLKAGMTVSASIPAAVMAMLIFKMVLGGGTILESNQVQTCASAGESLAAGIIFTMPALVMMGYWTDFDYWTVTGIGFTGGLLGILFMIPMRRVFVTDNPELPFPEGVACAAVLEAGEEEAESDGSAAAALVMGGLLGGLFKYLGSFVGLFVSTVEGARAIGSRVVYYGFDASPMLIAVGLIVRLNVAVLIFIGGAIAWLIAMPMFSATELLASSSPVDVAWELWSTKIRYVGVGAMVVGGVSSIVSVRSGLVRAVQQLWAGVFGNAEQPSEEDRDMPSAAIVWLAGLSIAILAFLYYRFTGSASMTAIMVVVMVVMAFFFTAVASYIVGLVGNSNSPVSGMTITALLFTGGMLWLFGYREGSEATVAILGVAAVVCCVACTSGDVCNDLKTGSLVGARPALQQWMQVGGVTVAAMVMAPVLSLLHNNTPGGIGGRELAAPQAGLMKSLAEGFTGKGDLPWNLIGYGALVGVAILWIDALFKARRARFRAHLMPIAVGMYLPFGLATPILIGGLIAHLATRGATSPEEADKKLHKGVLFASGVIAGESLMGVALAGLIALSIGVKAASTTLVMIAVVVTFTWMTLRNKEEPSA